MRTKTALLGVVAAGAVCALLTPSALATTSTTPPTSSTSATPTTTTPAPKSPWLLIAPKSGRPGDAVFLQTNCTNPTTIYVTALDLFAASEILPATDGPVRWEKATVKDVPAGVYQVSLDCRGGENNVGAGKASTTFTVRPKAATPPTKPQVPAKPVGAPQTGGGFTATDFAGDFAR